MASPRTSAAGAPADAASVKSADRVLDILELLGRQGSALSHHEIGTTLGIPKSSLTHLLRNLVAREFLAYESAKGVYSMGPAVHRLVSGRQDREALIALARPVVDWIAKSTGEAAAYSVLRDGEVERVCVAESKSPLSYRMAVGDRFPLYSTSAGKAMLAALPPEELADWLDQADLQRHTASTIRSVSALRKELQQVRKTGIAYSRGEHTPGVVGMAIAMQLPGDPQPSALNVVVPSVRLTPDTEQACLDALRQARQRLETGAR
ncbi:IclR family transcriptional regulator [Ramlibacter sp. G-1-2-2]|uniref:IclR family transcriptional regulator n=1 Tax=Ramlibacter agri TaxID=2728837 RepID=A0A848HD48_9BURK|nr:IclR family transcriptional regulator [Ramlibacter agri]NML47399.1 IclR family transcriptional regulator [Ramlibacter agri]